ncbi:hypothetical protein BSL78_18893 [Apostichopus japonicus]|uniref:Uncharacterized protein n=1 Tax=Stichopus japonicus TaxID=307972 RepID=A0A2G8K8C4_STIJA|nr:hypothetical protein BSL78_18893 [Apostichopus japonicus]
MEFLQGDRVFYKRDDSNRWRGPGKVIGQDGKVVFVSQLIRVASCRAIKTHPDTGAPDKTCKEEMSKETDGNEIKQQKVLPQETPAEEFMDEEIETNIEQEQEHIEEPALDNSHTSNTELPENQPQQQANPENMITKIDILNVNTKIKYCLQEDDVWTQLMERQTGRNKHYVNVQREEDEQKVGIHLDKVSLKSSKMQVVMHM